MNTKLPYIIVFFTYGCQPDAERKPLVDDLSALIIAADEEAEGMLQRRYRRESLREQGLWFCEEGEWPQRWQEDCNTCWCEPGGVRACTKAGCVHGDRPPRVGRMCRNPEIEIPPYVPPPECQGPPAMGPMLECFDYFEDIEIDWSKFERNPTRNGRYYGR